MTKRGILARLGAVIETRKEASPESSYVAALLAAGEDAVLQKIGEEATELLLAAKGGEKEHIVHETADLWFHCLVMLSGHGLAAADVLAELERRFGRSGLEEQASRR